MNKARTIAIIALVVLLACAALLQSLDVLQGLGKRKSLNIATDIACAIFEDVLHHAGNLQEKTKLGLLRLLHSLDNLATIYGRVTITRPKFINVPLADGLEMDRRRRLVNVMRRKAGRRLGSKEEMAGATLIRNANK